MPRLKESPGKIQLSTPLTEEFQRWLCFELVNAQEWNKSSIEGGMTGTGRWRFSMFARPTPDDVKKLWTIEFDGARIHVTSDEPIVSIRKGLRILMGQGRLELC